MNHDYFALKIHETRIADLQAEARHHSLARRALRARRELARPTTPASVLPLRPGDRGQQATTHPGSRDAA